MNLKSSGIRRSRGKISSLLIQNVHNEILPPGIPSPLQASLERIQLDSAYKSTRAHYFRSQHFQQFMTMVPSCFMLSSSKWKSYIVFIPVSTVYSLDQISAPEWPTHIFPLGFKWVKTVVKTLSTNFPTAFIPFCSIPGLFFFLIWLPKENKARS